MNDNIEIEDDWELNNGIYIPILIRQEIEVLGPDEPRRLHTGVNSNDYFFHDKIIINSKKKIGIGNRIRAIKKIGWTVSETIGIGVINPRAISKLYKDI